MGRIFGAVIFAAVILAYYTLIMAATSHHVATKRKFVPPTRIVTTSTPVKTVPARQQATLTALEIVHVQAAVQSVYAPLAPIPRLVGKMPNLPQVRDPGPVRSTISIPRLGITAPIFDGEISNGQPTIAPGYGVTKFPYSGLPGDVGNYVVYGHDDIEGSIFQSLASLSVGDMVYVYSGQQKFGYRVSASIVVDPTDISVMNATPNAMLTLISCVPLYVDTSRIVVQAVLVS